MGDKKLGSGHTGLREEKKGLIFHQVTWKAIYTYSNRESVFQLRKCLAESLNFAKTTHIEAREKKMSLYQLIK